MAEHFLVVDPDTAYVERFGDDPEDPALKWHIECSDPEHCPGWEECREDHDHAEALTAKGRAPHRVHRILEDAGGQR